MAIKITCVKVSKWIVFGMNCIFLMLSIGVIVAGVIGFKKINDFTNKASLLNDLDTRDVALLIAATGVGTCIASMIGLVGALKNWSAVLKIYAMGMFLVSALQLALGIYMLRINVDNLASKWNEEDAVQRRGDFMDAMRCCYWTSPDPYYPSCPASWTDFIYCREAANNFMNTYMRPVGLAAIIIACAELVAMIWTCIIIQQFDTSEDQKAREMNIEDLHMED